MRNSKNYSHEVTQSL
jgi:hypothetical protein